MSEVRRMRKRTAYGLMLGITLSTVGAMLWVPGEAARTVRAQQVEVRGFEERVEGGGVLGRSGEYSVSSLSGGVVAQVFVSANQRVEAGQALFRLDTSAQEQALASLLRSEGEDRALQAQALDGAASAWQDGAQWVNEARGTQARIQREQLEAQIAAMTVRAQEAGEVLSTYVCSGEVLMPGVPALTLAQEKQVVRMQVGEREALRLQPGLKARFLRDDALLGEGTVASVGMPTTRPDGVLSVAVELSPLQAIELPVGARLDVEIVCQVQEDALLVPLDALDEQAGTVWQVYKQRAWQVPVEVGLQDALHVAVSGLPDGAWVVLQPPADLRQGELVEVSGS